MSKTSKSRFGKWALALTAMAVMAVMAGLIAWLAGWIPLGTDPRVQEILALQQQAGQRYAAAGGPSNIADATAAFTSMVEIRQKTEQLPPHLRPQVEEAGGKAFQAIFMARIDHYFTLPPQQRHAELDRQIDQEEMMRKAFEAGRSVMGALGGGQGSSGQASSTQGSGGPPTPPGGPRGGSRSEEERNRWRKSMIDRTTPQERARFTEHRRAMDARREQRGLPTFGPR